MLRWKPNPAGRRPVKYRVYGSDEKGFTASDENFQGTVGATKEEMAQWNPWFPANFIAETAATELPVIGSEVSGPGLNQSFYRVVAVDEQGKRSGPSDFAEAPRPVIYSKPTITAQVGAEYRYELRANRSLGDLSAQMRGDNQVSGYFGIEQVVFGLEKGPAWLKMNETNGILSGVPDSPGDAEVIVAAVLTRPVRKLDEKALVWGNEKVLSQGTEQVGAVRQKFIIEIK
jgi:hypothetical protein